MDTDVLFGLGVMAAVEADTRLLFTDAAKSLFLPARKECFQYVVYSVKKDLDVTGAVNNYLQVPAGVAKVSQLARDITGRVVDDVDKASQIERVFSKTNYTYSLFSRKPPAGMRPVDDFLFNSKRGYCEHYASAMVLMLRTIGIPARIVTGFYGGSSTNTAAMSS